MSGPQRPVGVRRRHDDGAGTVLALAMMGLLVVVGLGVAGVVGVVAAHRGAQSAADLAALAGAAALQDGADPCERATEVARRNRADLRACEVDGWSVAVTATAPTPVLLGRVYELPARARAGPAPVP